MVLFVAIGVTAGVKKFSKPFQGTSQNITKTTVPLSKTPVISVPVKAALPTVAAQQIAAAENRVEAAAVASKDDFPNIDRCFQLFTTGPSKLPIVETVSYSSTVPWLKGKPAWVADYATYYATSRHFIARSLNGKCDYFSQKVSSGSRFNVFRKDKNIQFHLLIDASRCKMGFYYVDLGTNERVLLKTYRVGLGRIDSGAPSGTLTPLGSFTLGNKIAIYGPGTEGLFQDKKIEMIRVFGTRWIPFQDGVDGSSVSGKGYGLHGAPWVPDPKTGALVEKRDCIGVYDSDGCVRLCSEDIEELFSIVVTKPTFVHIVDDFHKAKLPGIEVATPTR